MRSSGGSPTPASRSPRVRDRPDLAGLVVLGRRPAVTTGPPRAEPPRHHPTRRMTSPGETARFDPTLPQEQDALAQLQTSSAGGR
jgi:hypothetical protein